MRLMSDDFVRDCLTGLIAGASAFAIFLAGDFWAGRFAMVVPLKERASFARPLAGIE